MIGDDRGESARERATRKWHNNYVMRQLVAKAQEPEDQPQPSSRARKEILAIFSERNKNILVQYMISINERHKRLLREKLRRLKEKVDG